MQIGGNKVLFELLKEYELGDQSIPMRYRHAALRWFKRRHLMKLEGREQYFTEPKPFKNMNERINKSKALFKQNIDEMNPKIQEFENKSVEFSVKVD